MDICTISPFVRVAWDCTLSPNRFIKQRVIYDFELLYLKEGELQVIIDGMEYHGVPGDLFFFRPKQAHSIRVIKNMPVRQPHVHFDFFEDEKSRVIPVSFDNLSQIPQERYVFFREDISNLFEDEIPSIVHLHYPIQFESILFELINEYSNRTIYSDIKIKGIFLQLWAQFLRELKWDKTTGNYGGLLLAQEVKTYLDSHMNEVIKLDHLSNTFHVSKYYLSRKFSLAFGVSPIKYHLITRLRKAELDLLHSDISVSSVSEKYGFQSIHSFSRTFKTHTGFSPSEIRNSFQCIKDET